ncbi:MAG: UbiA family prenyltransferase, partial [Phycisphaerae bacterium]|nr:UbiA family prenyltransferase [Phycisphaerae bacterium]
MVATAAAIPAAQWHWEVLVASVLGVVLLHAAGNLLNDYFDFRSGVDRKVEGDEGRPGRVLVRGELAPKEVLLEAIVCLMLALPLA